MGDWPNLQKVFTKILTVDDANLDTGANAIPANFDILEVWVYARTDEAVRYSVVDLTINGDTGANYDSVYINYGAGPIAGGNGLASSNRQYVLAGSSVLANYFSYIHLTFPFYSQTSGFKIGSVENGELDSSTSGIYEFKETFGWRSTAAINRIAITPDTAGKKFKTGSRMMVLCQ